MLDSDFGDSPRYLGGTCCTVLKLALLEEVALTIGTELKLSVVGADESS